VKSHQLPSPALTVVALRSFADPARLAKR
jgi:hypothetical protein